MSSMTGVPSGVSELGDAMALHPAPPPINYFGCLVSICICIFSFIYSHLSESIVLTQSVPLMCKMKSKHVCLPLLGCLLVVVTGTMRTP